ncbi:hypothetical protein F0562_004960 [Nyssa sinensis]|uniref:Bidirectional sugar transporter SWEET n=1 Tax=Nyssa sinensis TaxID=561372 RepID=A0A5J5AMF2_9ASTE|nr:hypothetical protein F0562_004960 [Nyssa sinensis]
MNCMLWVLYGLPIVHPDSILVVTINGLGLVMELIYIPIYFVYADKKGRLKVISWIFMEVVFVAIVAGCTLSLLHTTARRSAVVGSLCIIFTALLYISPLTIIAKVIKTKSVKYMPFYLSLASFLSGIIWLTYALIKFDIYLVAGNGLGVLSGIVQLILYACYYKSTPKDDEEKPQIADP